MEEKIDKGGGSGKSEVDEERAHSELIDWCMKNEDDFPLLHCFMLAIELANTLERIGERERLIESAWKIADRLEPTVKALKG